MSFQHAKLCARLAAICHLALLACLVAPGVCQGVSFVSSEYNLVARAEASNIPADEFDVDNASVMLTNLQLYSDAVATTAITSTASSASNVILDASFTPTLIEVDGSGTADANGGIDNLSNAFATGDVSFVFSTPVSVDYDLSAVLSADMGDANLFLLLRDQSDSSLVFSREVFAFGFEEPMMTGTLAPGTYEFSTGISPSAFTDDFTRISPTNASLSVELAFDPVPEPTTVTLLTLAIVGGAMVRRLG